MKEDKCLFCQDEKSNGQYTDGDKWHYQCPYCGIYEVTDSARRELLANSECAMLLNHLASLTTERSLQGKKSFLLGTHPDPKRGMISYVDLLKEYPSDFREQHDRALLNLARLANYSPLCEIGDRGKDPTTLFCDSDQDMYSLLKILREEGYVDFNDRNFLSGEVWIEKLFLTVDGFEYAVSLKKDISKRKRAFVAMWFSDEMKLYAREVAKAIEQAGYEPYIANRDSYNGLIMNKVLNEISEARFLIADLTSISEKDSRTGVRGGVYFEAGYAAGQGLEVILTCREDVTSRIHFDLKQFLGIYWKEAEDGNLLVGDFNFVEYLKNHILQTVGPGPRYGQTSDAAGVSK